MDGADRNDFQPIPLAGDELLMLFQEISLRQCLLNLDQSFPGPVLCETTDLILR